MTEQQKFERQIVLTYAPVLREVGINPTLLTPFNLWETAHKILEHPLIEPRALANGGRDSRSYMEAYMRVVKSLTPSEKAIVRSAIKL